MDTGAIRLSTRALPEIPDVAGSSSTTQGGRAESGDFAKAFEGAISDVQGLQDRAGQLTQRLISGDVTDVHQVMIAGEEASVAFELMMEIRNKLLEAYQEVMRMQV